MILKIVIPILGLWIFGYYDGVQCAGPTKPINQEDLKAIEKYRQRDIFKYLNYGIEDFDEHNRHCYLAFLVYLSKKLFHDGDGRQLKQNINKLQNFTENIYRVLSTEFTIKFDNKTLRLQDQIYVWFATNLSHHVETVVGETNEIIELGLSKYIWKTEKEFEIIRMYRKDTNTEAELVMIQKAYEVCQINYENLTKPTYAIGLSCAKASRHQQHLLNYYNFVPTELQDFGPLTLFITDDEYRSLKNDNDNMSRNLYIVEFLEQVLIEIIRHMNAVLQQMNDIINLPDMTKIDPDLSNVEQLFILRHLYLKATNTTHDLYLLFRILNQKTQILKEYILFSVSFKNKWTTIFSQTKKRVKFSLDNKKTSSSIQASNLVKKETQKIVTPEAHLNQRKCYDDDEVYDPTKDLDSVDLGNVDQGRFSERKPSFIRLYSVFNNSWYEPAPSESSLHEKKVILYELNAMLTVVKHHIYSLTIAARSKQKKNPAWDCGFINGISAPQSGPLDYRMDKYQDMRPNKFNSSLKDELKSARKFLMEYRCPTLQ